ncbi:trehalose-6-phosphate synthase [Sulfitobacter sp. D35]|uniref:alpha,alpha-trehalose-phosphate synthase (UDP-forming) n=1 Tax=Sulfitobacter sp. D35 TaxID=3083252 RepID=UPI00296F71E7|nr:trehalose-6-phosphate synthase [Sulfitobacter sp. D35]MDW4500186.1 trehalose-6-phosphate synthase [Sulfitobacter sp. D35]
MSGRLVVVSNRIPTGEQPSGGLVVALHDALSEIGGVWIGAHPDGDAAPDHDGLFEIADDPYTRLAFRLNEDEYDNYYLGFSNSVLWPICHRRVDLVELKREYEEGYHAVNARLAKLIAEVVEPDDLIWIHDYHLFPLAEELRKLGVTARIGFFLHIPFPALGDLGALPAPQDFARWLAAFDLVGLQTRADTARCFEMFRSDPRAEFLPDGRIKLGERRVAVRAFPIGIDVEAFRSAAEQEMTKNPFGPDMQGDVVLGVDRLDYSKGIPTRFHAFGRYLAKRPDKDRRTSLVQIAPPSREEVAAYRQIQLELEEIAGHLNGEYSELDWTPIRYIHRALDRDLLAQLYRRSRACLVTPFADGMNLVAKEYIAAQDPEDPGVLILSRLAGAAEELEEALLVNPYDIEEIAEAIETALDMPLDERKRRQAACYAAVTASDISVWTRDFLRAFESGAPGLKMSDLDSDRPAPAFG